MVGGKLGPSWYQNLKNVGSKMMSKKVMQNSCAGRDKYRQVSTGIDGYRGSRPLKNYQNPPILQYQGTNTRGMRDEECTGPPSMPCAKRDADVYIYIQKQLRRLQATST